MKKLFIILPLAAALIIGAYVLYDWSRLGYCPFFPSAFKMAPAKRAEKIEEMVQLVHSRQDSKALQSCEQMLLVNPNDPDALWAKAEILRRKSDYIKSEAILHSILNKDPQDCASLISLAFIRVKDNRLDEALGIARRVLQTPGARKYDQAMAYIIMSSVYGKKALDGWLFDKLKYGPKIKQSLLCAHGLAPESPEVKLGMATYYLLAPAVLGGDFKKSVTDLESLVKESPEFASAHARLAQAYFKENLDAKAKLQLKLAFELDPFNEVAKEVTAQEAGS